MPKAEFAYRPFFVSAIFFLLVTGVGWGVIFLLAIATSGKVTATGLPYINAHGHSLIFGTVTLFIIGFAAQAFPRLLQRPLVAPALLNAVLGLLVVGVGATILAQVGAFATSGPMVALLAGILEAIAVSIFALQLVLTHRQSPTTSAGYWWPIYASLVFIVVCSLADGALTWAQLSTESRSEMIYVTSIYQPAVRYLEYHGMILLMIVGVAGRMLPAFFPIPAPSSRKMQTLAVVLASAAIAEALLFVTFRLTEQPHWGILLVVPWLILAGGSAWLLLPWRPWKVWPDRANGRIERTGKFVRASLIWLMLAWGMNLLLPIWGRLMDTEFSHAFHGAARQAFVVGFVLQMIVGFSSRVVPNLNAILPTELPGLRGVFWMLNIGLAVHIAGFVAMDLTSSARWVLPLAGLLQLVSLVWWAVHLLSCIVRGARRNTLQAAQSDRPSRKVALTVLQSH